ncbi:RNA methyltransferase, TrmH family [Spiroplasma chinense]|uniref:RNA methyltransferase, TrmH family n=1 Tax=Spiroplasma chinense TaxID=216932 RepID=A0A5B9Y5Y2_9MOLU|nr:RNA methyltransferase [Spiroplasma chinense]QEH62126.1 RNA methyltransferase, TrmH family [Spiroplasma chinense]
MQNNMDKITSVKNQLILDACELKQKKQQFEKQQYLVEGLNIVLDAIKNDAVELVLTTQKYLNNFESVKVVEISENVADKLSDLKNSQHVFAICKILKTEFFEDNVLVLDNIQDPGNLGTLIRSAKAFGFKNIYCSKETVSLYNPKVLRAIQGNHFEMNIIYGDLIELISDLKEKGYFVVGTFLRDESQIKDIGELKNKKVALVLGNEGQGIGQEVIKQCDKNYILNTTKDVESLNVAIAGSIIMHNIFN